MNGTDPLGLTDELDLGIPGIGRFASTVTGRTGGAVPPGDPIRLESERLGRAYATAPRGGPFESLRSLFGGPETQPEIMDRLLKMRPLMQEERAQKQEARKQHHEEEKQRLDVAKHIGGRLDKFFALPRDQQAILAPWIEQEMTFALPRIGVTGATPETIRGLLARPDLVTMAKMLMGVEQMTKSQEQQAQAAFGAALPEKYLEVMTKLKTDFTAQADTDLRQLLPVFVQGNGSPGTGLRDRLGLPEGAVMPYQAFLQGVRDIANSDAPGLKELASNRFYRDAFTALMKDEEFVTGLGVQSPKGTYEAQKARGVRAGQLAAEREPEAVRGAAEKALAVAAGTARGQLQPDIIASQVAKDVQAKVAEIIAASRANLQTPQGQQALAKAVADVAHVTAQTALNKAQQAQVEQRTATGQVVPFQAEGGIATVKPPAGVGTPPIVTIVQAPGKKPPPADVRATIAEGRALLSTLDDLTTTIEKNPGFYFGYGSAVDAATSRFAEQMGAGKAKADWEKMWADLDFQRAALIKKLEQGPITKSDIAFFLSSWPERTTAPSVGVIQLRSALRFARSKIEAMSEEFGQSGGSAEDRARSKYPDRGKR